MLTANKVKDLLRIKGVHPDVLSKKGNEYTARWGFFYTQGRSAEKYAAAIAEAIPTSKLTDKGQVWKSFRGDATVAQGSHFFVKFTIPEGK